MTPEGKVKKLVRDELDLYAPEVWYCMPIGTMYGKSGVPDFIGTAYGYFFSIETKAGKNKPTGLQNLVMSKIKEAGGYALVINEDNIDGIQEMIQECEDKYNGEYFK